MLALQGGFAAHIGHLAQSGADPVEVRQPQDFDGLDGLILPGGESTTILKGIARDGLDREIHRHHEAGKPILGTCAGMIIAGSEHLGLIDITTRRNAFGRQLASFEQDLELPGMVEGALRAVFIRAPWIETAAPEVEVLTTVRGHPVAASQGQVSVLAFHPELTPDRRVHDWFVARCRN